MKRLLVHSSVCSMRDQLRLVFTSFLNVDDSDDSTLNPPPSPSIREGSADAGSDAAQEEIPSELERKGFHYLNDVQVCNHFYTNGEGDKWEKICRIFVNLVFPFFLHIIFRDVVLQGGQCSKQVSKNCSFKYQAFSHRPLPLPVPHLYLTSHLLPPLILQFCRLPDDRPAHLLHLR